MESNVKFVRDSSKIANLELYRTNLTILFLLQSKKNRTNFGTVPYKFDIPFHITVQKITLILELYRTNLTFLLLLRSQKITLILELYRTNLTILFILQSKKITIILELYRTN